jgi:hypothetical protein
MLSQDESQATLCPSLVANCTPEVTAVIHYTVGRLIPPSPPLQCNSARICAPQLPLALLGLVQHWSISFHTRFPPAHLGSDGRICCGFHIHYPTPILLLVILRKYGCSPIPVSASQPRLGAPQSQSQLHSIHLALLNPCLCFSA